MERLQRNAWRGLLAPSVLIGLVELWALFDGIAEDPSVPLGLTVLTASQLASESPNGSRFADFSVRAGGLGLVVTGTLLATIAMFAFRQHQRWAWWVMWVLPIWRISAFVLLLAVGVSPGQAPPTPMITGPIVVVVSATLLLVSASGFLGRHPPIDEGTDVTES